MLYLALHFCLVNVSAAKEVTIIVKFRSKNEMFSFIEQPKTTSISKITPFVYNNYNSPKNSKLSNNAQYEELEKYAKVSIDEKLVTQKLSEFGSEKSVEFAYRMRSFRINEVFPSNDSLSARQWNLFRIGMERAWKISVGDGIKVGIIDTGIDFNHEDLKSNMWINNEEDINKNGTFEPWFNDEVRNGVKGDFDGIDNDGNGLPDDVIGYDFVDQSFFNVGDASIRDPLPIDEQGHGTQCAGIIAATSNNGKGGTGIAPKSKLVSLRAFDASGNGEEDDIAAAILYAALNGIHVLSMSFGDIVESPLVRDAVRFAHESGTVLCSSSGNDNQQMTRLLRRFPASYGEVIAVGAITDRNIAASFSSYGSYLGLSAPGVGIITTKPNNQYNYSFQGTSAAAPHVAAVAALLLSANPSLTSEDIRGILLSTCDDAGTQGWDERYGAGILNAASALENANKTRYIIESPKQGQVFNRSKTQTITISGSTLVPLFQYSELFYTVGDANEKTQWTQIGQRKNERIMSSTIGSLEIGTLKDTSYTIRLVIYLTNGNTLERRNRIDIVSSNSPLLFRTVHFSPIWYNKNRRVMCSIVSSKRCRTSVHLIRKSDNITVGIFEDNRKYTRNHSLILDYPFDIKQNYFTRVFAIIDDVDTVTRQNDLLFNDDRVFRSDNLTESGLTLPISYLSPEINNFYSDKPCIAVINSEQTKFGDLQIIEYDGDKLNVKESTNDTWIPQGFGDSNGDGIQELLCYRRDASLYSSRSFQKTDNNTTFSNAVFSSEVLNIRKDRREFSAAAFFDIDKDGKEEIFGFRDTVLSIVKFDGSIYREIALLPNISPRGGDGGENSHERPNCIVEDIDNDGKLEIIFADSDADIMIYEYNNNTYTLEQTIFHEGEGGTEFLQTGDIDGDGKKELVFGYYNYQSSDSRGEFEPSVWNYHIITSDSPNSYIESDPEVFYGVRIGTEYERGFRIADIDNLKGDELLFSMFPRVYIMKWDTEKKRLHPFWYSDTTFTKTFIIGDIKKNKETLIGITNFNNVTFYKVSNELPSGPEIIEARPLNEDTPFIRWKEFDTGITYKIDGYLFPFPNQPDNTPDISVTTNELETNDILLNTDTPYKFFITALKNNVPVSKPSETPIIYLHKRTKPLSISVVNDRTLRIKFDGYLPDNVLPTSVFAVSERENSEKVVLPITVLHADDSNAIITFVNPFDFIEARITIESFTDRYFLLSERAVFDFETLQSRHFDSLYLSSIKVVNSTTLNLLYSKNFDEQDASTIANYTLEPFGIIQTISVDNKSSVTISLDGREPLIPIGKNYTLRVSNVKDISGQMMTRGAGSVIGFTLAANNTDNAFVFPSPVRLSEKTPVFFGNLPPRATITILTLEGKELNRLQETDGNGGVEWNGKTSDNSDMSTGVYLFKVTQTDENGVIISSSLKKFSITR